MNDFVTVEKCIMSINCIESMLTYFVLARRDTEKFTKGLVFPILWFDEVSNLGFLAEAMILA